MFKKIRHLFEYGVVVGIFFCARLLPSAVLLFFGRCLGIFAYYCVPVRKKQALENLARAFPEKISKERYSIVYGLYQHLGMMVVNHCLFSRMTAGDILEKVQVVDDDVLRRALAKGKGVILTGAHFGDWEISALAIGAAGFPLSLVMARIHNPYINKMIIKHRQGMGVKLISSRGISIRDILIELKNKNCVGLLIDQSAGRNGLLIDFFGRKASTVKGPAQIAVKRGVPLLLCTSTPQSNGHHRMIFEEIPTDIEGLEGEAQVLHITQQVTSKIEHYIRQKPEVWFGWFHRRWRIKPPKIKG